MRLKDLIRATLPRSWWDELRRVKRRSPDLASPRAMAHLRRMKARGFAPRVVLDVGAAHGDWTASCRRIFPDARFIMVEPLPDYAPELRALGVEYVQAAAGRAEQQLPLLVPDDPGGSSFLAASREGDTFFKRSVTVPVIPLDGLALPPEPTLLKLDVQGYELEVLAGAHRTLEQVEVIITECSLYPFQRDIPLVHEVVQHVVALGYRVYDVALGYRVYDVADETRWSSGTLAQVDLLFVAASSALLDPLLWT